MARLYAATAEGERELQQAELARRLNTSSQRVKNWETRGISQQGANEAQAIFGVSSTWILSGAGSPRVVGTSQAVGFDDATMSQALELLYLLGDARPDDWRFRRLTWPAVKVAAKAIHKADGDARKAMAEILSELPKVMADAP